MKNTIKMSLTISFLIVLLISSSVIAQEDTNWNDNFDDNKMTGWNPLLGEFVVNDGKLRANSSDVGYLAIDRVSKTAYGVWTFDILSVNQKGAWMIFIGTGSSYVDIYNYTATKNSYALGIFFDFNAGPEQMVFSFGRTVRDIQFTSLGEFAPEGRLNGWQSINITRNTEGLFKIYVNDALRIEATDNKITSSDRFEIFSEPGMEFDNIEVTAKEILPEIVPTSSESKEDDAGSSAGEGLFIVVFGISFIAIYQNRLSSNKNNK